MTHRKRILFLTDFSDNARNAFNYALHFALERKAGIDVLHVVVPEIEASDIPVMAGRATVKRREVATEVLESFIQNGKQQIDNSDKIQLTGITRVGNILKTVLEEVKEHGYDLVILGNRGETKSAAEKFLGTISLRIMQRLSCPVLLVPANATYQSVNQMAFASDLSASDPYHLWQAIRLVEPESPVVRWIHVKNSDDDEDELDEFESFYQNRAPSVQIHFHELEGVDVSNEIESFVESLELDLLVLVKSHKNLFERMLHPSITRKLANESHIPLLIMD